ncbi:MAG: oligogalacturonate lyase family protein [Terracidiphilus sp.]
MTVCAHSALFLCCFVSVAAAQQSPAPSAAGQEPPTSWIDAETGHRVVRLTKEPDSASFYFNVNSYTPDGKEMVYTTPEGISALDLTTGNTRSVVHGPARTIEVGRKTPSVFYIKPEDRSLYVTNIDTGETRKLAQMPEGGSLSAINADETLAAGTYIEGSHNIQPITGAPPRDQRDGAQQAQPLNQPENKGQMMERRLAAHLPLVLFVIDLRTGEMRTLLHSTDWVNHLQFSPVDPKLLLYCHEGPWHKVDRIWMIRADGTHNTLIHKRTMFMEIAGHEFWSHDGKTIWFDLQTPKGQDFWLAGYGVNTGKELRYHLERNEWSIHFNVSRDGSLFCGDGGDPGQVAHAPDGEWIYLFHPEILHGDGIDSPEYVEPGVLQAERLVKMSKHNYRLEPNVSFTPDMKWIVFRSNMFGATYVFAVEVAKSSREAKP